MKNIINEELNYIKYLFDYQKGKVISEQKNIILEESKITILPENIVPCPSDETELSKFIQVDDISSKEAKFYLDNVKLSNKRQLFNNFYYKLKSDGVFFIKTDKKYYLDTYPTLKDHLIDAFEATIKKDSSGDFLFLYNDGSYKKPKFIDQEKIKEQHKKNIRGLTFAIYYPIKQVCLKQSNQSSYPEETTTTTTTIKPQPVVPITPELTNTIEYPEYNPPLEKKSFGYNPKGKILNPFDNKNHYGGFYPKYTKKMKEIETYYYGYDDEDGNHIDGEIEKAKKQNRRINFLKPFSKDDISSQQTYNDEFDQYLQSQNQASVKK